MLGHPGMSTSSTPCVTMGVGISITARAQAFQVVVKWCCETHPHQPLHAKDTPSHLVRARLCAFLHLTGSSLTQLCFTLDI
uniref:Uncharacterized protein n=1 Tax=Anguilla anguilla TaxID=7936 RepID=A0A0E9W616_ANGAN